MFELNKYVILGSCDNALKFQIIDSKLKVVGATNKCVVMSSSTAQPDERNLGIGDCTHALAVKGVEFNHNNGMLKWKGGHLLNQGGRIDAKAGSKLIACDSHSAAARVAQKYRQMPCGMSIITCPFDGVRSYIGWRRDAVITVYVLHLISFSAFAVCLECVDVLCVCVCVWCVCVRVCVCVCVAETVCTKLDWG